MFSTVKAVLFDLDGTLYYGDKAADGAVDTVRAMRERGLRVFFLTNNSTRMREQICRKLNGMDIPCSCDEVFTSGYTAALYAKKERLPNVYIFGSADLKREFEQCGVNVADEASAENLVIGYDPNFSYDGLTAALNVALKSRMMISCNSERRFPGNNARLMPGCGAMVASIEHCSGRKSDYIIGKPNTLMIDMLCEIYGYSSDELLVVGDTYESDILMANRKGVQSVLISSAIYDDCVSISRLGELENLFMSGKG